MKLDYENVKKFLEDPNNFEELLDSDSLIWIDWREYDEDIISYVNEKIEDKIEIVLQDNGKPYGEDIILKHKDKSLMIPYKEKMDRDTTIKYLNAFIQPKYEIRFCIESLGNDTLAYVVLTKDLWEQLENEFGKEKVRYYFEEINLQSKMFDMDFETVFKMRGERLGIY
ncbi:hypothetical protein [Gemelliphila palaticanis]|uniref:Glutathione reductase n=1 Tax=Gemelliphila palaticanis TaxID=81950 RepID=A0ABX2T0B5_9BACL|nr:hypothetical protein [Gemella palaticanis]MBF0715681.1 hypothetical protein [Gemella palaticanis]NYS47611.1 hypothetical protein [Gemella palaticanis]